MARGARHPRDDRRRVLRPAARAREGAGVTNRRIWWALPAVIAGSAFVAAATAASDDWQRGFDRTSELVSPLPPTAASAAGRAIYTERCLPCHGPHGRGDGPAGAALDPRPADLLLHVPQHTDGELFYFISRGIPASAMPAWRTILSETERWELVQYLREIGRGAP